MRSLILVAGMALPMPALAQDVGPALDPGAMVGWAGGEAVRADLEKRAGRRKDVPPMSTSEQKARRTCAYRYTYSSRWGVDDPRTRRLFALCSKLGYF